MRDRNTRLDGRDHRVAGGFDGWKRADAAADVFGNAVEPERDLGDDGGRSLRANDETRQIVAGEDLRARVPVRAMLPSGSTIVSARTLSRIVP